MAESNLDNRPLMVIDPDPEKRKPLEWAKIYFIKLVGAQKIQNKLMGEYEFAWDYINLLNYLPLKDDNGEFETYSNFELRAQGLHADMFINATLGEKEALRTKYIDTSFVRRQLKYI